MNVQPRSLDEMQFLYFRNICLIVIIVLFIKNVVIDKRPIFTILMNLFLIALTIPCLRGIMNLADDVLMSPTSVYSGYFFILNMIAIVVLFVLKKKYKLKKGMQYLIAIIIMMLASCMTVSSGADIMLEGDSARNFLIKDYTICMSKYLIQINLIISYINANWDCFKKKSGEILDSKE